MGKEYSIISGIDQIRNSSMLVDWYIKKVSMDSQRQIELVIKREIVHTSWISTVNILSVLEDE